MKWLLVVLTLLGMCGAAQAQGLIWSLPEDGKWVRYEGTYSQTMRRPESTDGDLTLQWRRNLTIKSVGTEEAEYAGQVQACRWIEFKTETGKTTEGVLDAGPGGIRMYKILVPEQAIRGTVNAPAAVPGGQEIFVSSLPIVKGYRRIGDEPAQEMASGVFQLYPVVSLLRHYRNLTTNGDAQLMTVPAGDFEAVTYSGKMVMETAVYRSTNSCEISRSEGIPFGVVKWTATTLAEQKGSTDERSEFRENAILKEEMQAVSVGSGAESEFLVN